MNAAERLDEIARLHEKALCEAFPLGAQVKVLRTNDCGSFIGRVRGHTIKDLKVIVRHEQLGIEYFCNPDQMEFLSQREPVDIDALVRDELRRATEKFPKWPSDPLHALAVLGEEFGELTQAVLQLVYEPKKSSHEHVLKEATQTAAMAYRFLRSLADNKYAYHPSQQHDQSFNTGGSDDAA